ncbi:hemolysin family protein [Bacteroides reticulotermitis]|nr:hemolysin family protein [Bacteroides reticulotermitis]MBB4042908.1 putative hemolysin [Bacteroides reticulotermitis]
MEFLIIILLLLVNGVFAMYEIALVSSSKARLETAAGKGNKSARNVLRQLEEPEKFLSTIQIGITLIGIISGAFGGVAIADEVTPLFAMIPGAEMYARNLAMITTVALITYLSLIIGELVPKSIALSNPERYATLFCPFIMMLTKISYPFVWLLSVSTRLLNRLIGLKSEERSMTQEEIKMILHQSSEQGVINKGETEMLRDVFRFSDKRANELMTYRRDLIILHPENTKEEVLQTIENEHFSKYLLVDEHKDEVVGVVSVKDIILMVGSDKEFNLREIARPPLFIPESLYANKVLELFKKNKNKFGIVVNEYGGIEGILTLHDLTESIFGDILEEDEMEEEEIVRRKDGSMLVEASMNIGDFMEEMGIFSYDDLDSEDFTTLSGLTMFLIGRVPKAGDIFTYKNLQFEVVDMDRGRVDKLLVTKQDDDEE